MSSRRRIFLNLLLAQFLGFGSSLKGAGQVTESMEAMLYTKLGKYWKWARLAILTGLRQGEQFPLRRDWLRLDDHYIRLPESKAGGAQDLFLPHEAVNILSEILDSHTSPYLFPSKNQDTCMDPRNFYNRIWVPTMKELVWEGITLHTLRHTFCSRLARSTPTFSDVLAGGRWKDPEPRYGIGIVTAGVYATRSKVRVTYVL